MSRKSDWHGAARKMSGHLPQHYSEVPTDPTDNKEAWPRHAKTFPGVGEVSRPITPEMARR